MILCLYIFKIACWSRVVSFLWDEPPVRRTWRKTLYIYIYVCIHTYIYTYIYIYIYLASLRIDGKVGNDGPQIYKAISFRSWGWLKPGGSWVYPVFVQPGEPDIRANYNDLTATPWNDWWLVRVTYPKITLFQVSEFLSFTQTYGFFK